jgi:hypothetical protein
MLQAKSTKCIIRAHERVRLSGQTAAPARGTEHARHPRENDGTRRRDCRLSHEYHDCHDPPPRLPVNKAILQLPVKILPQPDEITCGPTCLQAVYRYWGEQEPLDGVIGRAGRLEHGGTFAVFLACDALRKGYQATIYTYNLNVFDPVWFKRKDVDIADRLQRQREHKVDYRLQHATTGYLEFLALGGRLRLHDPTRGLICGILRRNLPIITGLSSTYLYRMPREFGPDDQPDDVRGVPSGHFVVIAGYDPTRRTVLVVDPYAKNPYASTHEYWLGIERVVGAVLLGIVTHDANLLIIHPRHPPRQEVP